MKLIQTLTTTVSGTSFVFSNIPQNFKDLVILTSLRGLAGSSGENIPGESFGLVINNAATYGTRKLQSIGAISRSFNDDYVAVGWMPGSTATADIFNNGYVYISNYTSTNPKSAQVDSVTETMGTSKFQELVTWSNASTLPITQISIGASTSGLGFAVGSTVSLYGVLADSDGITVVS